MSIANNLFDFSPFGRRPLVQHLLFINFQILKQVQDDGDRPFPLNLELLTLNSLILYLRVSVSSASSACHFIS